MVDKQKMFKNGVRDPNMDFPNDELYGLYRILDI